MRRFLIVAAVAAQCISGQLARADSNSEPPLHIDVRYADLDLAHIAGATALYTRLRVAVRRVCAPLESRELERAQHFHACIADALATAVAKVNQPLLSTYYQAKRGGTGAVNPEVARR
jgi:UrcA family protein